MPEALHSMFDSAGPVSSELARLTWWFLGISAIVYVATLIPLGIATWRGSHASQPAFPRHAERAIWIAGIVTVAILTLTLIVSIAAGRTIADEQGRGSFPITIAAQQWWWQAEYPNTDPSLTVITANEIHIPTGRRIHFQLRGVDVIHSFWVPSLGGKRDLIPGRDTEVWFEADQPGTYRGQCAEYCGLQHAHMAIEVIAQPPAEFEQWLEQQRQNAREAQSPEEQAGRQVFQSQSCGFCHALRGIGAFGSTAPDLTHVASRRTIAAGTLPPSPENLAQWIGDAQHFKPGTRMPSFALSKDQLQHLATYLGSLK